MRLSVKILKPFNRIAPVTGQIIDKEDKSMDVIINIFNKLIEVISQILAKYGFDISSFVPKQDEEG